MYVYLMSYAYTGLLARRSLSRQGIRSQNIFVCIILLAIKFIVGATHQSNDL